MYKITNNMEIKTINNVCIYPLDYLENQELSEYDLDNLINGKSLLYSLIVGMIKMSGCNLNEESILKTIKEDSQWTKKYTWTKKQFAYFESKLYKIYYNLYRYNGKELESNVQWFMIMFALTVK